MAGDAERGLALHKVRFTRPIARIALFPIFSLPQAIRACLLIAGVSLLSLWAWPATAPLLIAAAIVGVYASAVCVAPAELRVSHDVSRRMISRLRDAGFIEGPNGMSRRRSWPTSAVGFDDKTAGVGVTLRGPWLILKRLAAREM